MEVPTDDLSIKESKNKENIKNNNTHQYQNDFHDARQSQSIFKRFVSNIYYLTF